MKDGETASSYVTRLTKLRAKKKLKQIEALRIKTIKSKLKYEADSPAPSRPLTPKERAQAIKELQAQRRRDIECEIKDTLPKFLKMHLMHLFINVGRRLILVILAFRLTNYRMR